MDEKIYTRAFKIIQGHVMGVKGLERIYKGLQGYKRVNTILRRKIPRKISAKFQEDASWPSGVSGRCPKDR